MVSFSLMIGTAPNSNSVSKRISGVQVPGAMLHVFGRQQNLGGMAAVLVQRPFVGLDQNALPDGGDGLQMGQIGGAAGQSQAAHAGAHGPGTDQHHLAAGVHHPMDLLDQIADLLSIELGIRPGQHPGAHFHHDGGR